MIRKLKKVAIGLSGGVDSSVAAMLLQKEGYEVTGVHLICWDYAAPGCKGEEDRADAVKVAASLGIKFQVLDFISEYKLRVLNYFIEEMKAGRTPNPDVMCNKEIKFGLFYDWAMAQGFDYVATGHYAKIQKDSDFYSLLSGSDESKDQSYFLYRLSQEKLEHILFPLGGYDKELIRKMAKEAGLKTYSKPDSTGICFIGDVSIPEFIKKYIALVPGKVLDVEGKVIGVHDGVPLYTIGQRKGFIIHKYNGLPMYVVKKDAKANTITVGYGKNLEVSEFWVSDVSWINPHDELLRGGSFEVLVRIRNLGEKMPCKVSFVEAGGLKINLNDPTVGVAPGQSAVLYLKDKVLGGGIIN